MVKKQIYKLGRIDTILSQHLQLTTLNRLLKQTKIRRKVSPLAIPVKLLLSKF